VDFSQWQQAGVEVNRDAPGLKADREFERLD
jgi:hypothetical protein